MLERSIPQYQLMRETCFDLGCKFVQHQTDIVDLGCSRGDALEPFITKYGAYNTYYGIEISQPMLEIARNRFKNWIDNGLLRILDMDLRTNFPPVNASLILSVLTIQFTPIEYRQKIIFNIYNHLKEGGAFIFIEKVLGADSVINESMVDLYYKMKSDNGYSQEQIERKRLSLEGVLVPVTAKWNEELLKQAGFKYIDCFWRWMNFAGWIAIK
jgi:tRNA (cmo5U34)-methyltransferase